MKLIPSAKFESRTLYLILILVVISISIFVVRNPLPLDPISTGSTSSKRLPVARPRLVLLVVVDQLRFDYLERFHDLYTGGFRTLLDKGALFTDAYYRHGINVTAAGHATIITGRHPATHGIVGNTWYDTKLRKPVTAVTDLRHKPIGGDGKSGSPHYLLVPTLGDQLKAQSPSSKVIAIGTKDRVAILLAGKKGDAAYWFSDQCRCLITSSYFLSQAPLWLTKFRLAETADSYIGNSWNRLLPNLDLYRTRAREDAFTAENNGYHFQFPHTPKNVQQFKASYYNDKFVINATLEIINFHQIGQDDTTDLLAVGLSATDSIGHAFGPFSQEAMDQNLRLDRLLGYFWQKIDQKIGLDNVLIILTSDHGVAPLVEYSRQLGRSAETVEPARIKATVERAVMDQFGLQGIVAYVDSSHVTLDQNLIQRSAFTHLQVEKVAKRALLSLDSVIAVYTHTDLRGESDAESKATLNSFNHYDQYRLLYRNSVYPGRSPHLLVQLKPFHLASANRGNTTHISTWNYDRHIPIFFMGANLPHGSYGSISGPEDIAPTVGKILQLDISPESDARILKELLE